MKNFKKIIALVLVCIMAFSALQVSASAASASASAYAETVENAINTLGQFASDIPVTTILIGILYAFFPVLIVIDLISYLVSGNAIIAGGLLNLF